ncbi:MAG TPA: response regulator [Candidatus Binatia bacterium]|jgi:DNA-binding NtrC family response regulator|nr:response regulator [Candidatus Binatia bacterium]
MEAPHNRILIVDDEENLLPLFKRILQKEGYEVECATSAEVALSQLKNQWFDLVISDLNMSGMNGLDLLKEAKAVNPALRFIMLTAFGRGGLGATAIKNGASDYLIKPVYNEELKLAVKKALELRQPVGVESTHRPEYRTAQHLLGTVKQSFLPLIKKLARAVHGSFRSSSQP